MMPPPGSPIFDDVRRGLEKTQNAVPNIRALKRAAMAGTVLPTRDALDTYLPTFIYISLVSLLDDALEAFIDTNYPGTKLSKLGHRIDFLGAKGRLCDPARLHHIRDARNAYAHEHGCYANWGDVEDLFSAVQV